MAGPLFLLFALTTFLSAFLVFQIQPIIGKAILPWFGGTSAVWSTCLLFFQVTLLLGYLYSDLAVRRLRPKTQLLLHLVLLGASLAALPILPGSRWKPLDPGLPVLHILTLLAATVGAPYFLLSTTAPLLQAWYVRSHRQAVPYPLYALSNAGSLLGLLSYPVAVEPLLTLRNQSFVWSSAYVLFGICCGFTGFLAHRAQPDSSETMEIGPGPGWVPTVLWTALPAVASSMLLSVTNQFTENVTLVPFLWILPLAIYLLSFILCFWGDGRLYLRTPFLALLYPALAGLVYLPSLRSAGLVTVILLYSACFFVVCMACHGELYRLRPAPRLLTRYYLMIALGGAVGGTFVALLAPVLFNGYLELPLTVAAAALLILVIGWADSPGWSGSQPRHRLGLGGMSLAAAAVLAAVVVTSAATESKMRMRVRNFYGSLALRDFSKSDPAIARRALAHGSIIHGVQFLHPLRRREPTAYFGPDSGVGLALRRAEPRPRRVGLIGLGAGTLAVYGAPGDVFRFYEINPLVIELARTEFSFLQDAFARIEIVPGDARLSMEREDPQGYDLIVIDAFVGSSPPAHLLTREAFALYERHLKERGLIALHLAGPYLDLPSVVEAVCRSRGWPAVSVVYPGDPAKAEEHSTWVLIARELSVFQAAPLWGRFTPMVPRPGLRPWTDDYTSLFGILRH